jgi:ComF family protein
MLTPISGRARLQGFMDIGITALGWIRRVSLVALDAVLPPQCLSCGVATDAPRKLCASCWAKITWLSSPLCACCGCPFEFDPLGGVDTESLMCGACLKVPPLFARARAVFRYDDASRGLILAFKHADRLHGVPAYGEWLARAGAELLGEAAYVAPVPLHWTRLAWRRYNQAALLADVAGRVAGRAVIPDLLVRARRTPQQGELGAAARRRNVRRAFRVNGRHADKLKGQRIVLVDDVFTTGATVEECTRALLDVGAAAVDVLTLARVVRPVAA